MTWYFEVLESRKTNVNSYHSSHTYLSITSNVEHPFTIQISVVWLVFDYRGHETFYLFFHEDGE